MIAALVAAMFVALQSAQADSHPHVAISIGDSDNTVKAGSYPIQLLVMNDGDTDGNTFLTYLRVAESTTDVLITGVTESLAGTADAPGAAEGTLVVREGASGEYTIIAGAAEDAAGTDIISGELTITVGDIGDDVGSAVITFGYTNAAGDSHAVATDTTRVQDTDTAAAGDAAGGATNIVLVLTVNNGLGEKTNDAGVNTITLIASGGRLNPASSPIAADSTAALTSATEAGSQTYAAAASNATMIFTVSRQTAGTVDVWAVVVGTDGSSASSEKVTLRFSGVATAISLGDVSGSLDDGDTDDSGASPANANGPGVYFDVTGMDKSGATSAITDAVVAATVTKVPTGGSTTDLVITEEAGSALTTTAALGAVRMRVHVASAATPKPGDYTIRVLLNDSAATAKTTTVTVVGDAETVELTADMTEATFGDIVTLTATVKDKNGNLVANSLKNSDDIAASVNDGVTFTWAESGLKATSLDGSMPATSGEREIVKGQATARFVVTSRTGDALVIANAGGKRATLALSAPAGPAPEAPEPDPTLASISLEVVGEDHSAGSVTVLASLADADGESVEGMVSFYHSGAATLFGPKDVLTSDGTATAEYHAQDDFTVLAISGSHRASLTIEVTSAAEQAAADQAEVDRIAAEEAEAQAERDRIAAEAAAAEAAAEAEKAAAEAARIAATVSAELDRLSGVFGFASWLAEGSTTASALFSALSDGGATAVHLWNGAAWVRYSVVDGSEVPGSVDFDVERGDVLFISN